jgi:preprotein translocase subunit SecG
MSHLAALRLGREAEQRALLLLQHALVAHALAVLLLLQLTNQHGAYAHFRVNVHYYVIQRSYKYMNTYYVVVTYVMCKILLQSIIHVYNLLIVPLYS